MCYYDSTRWCCGYWKWGNFREQCPKERRRGETCGMKLVFHTDMLPSACRLCEQMATKQRRLAKMADDVGRWQADGNRRATVEKTRAEMAELQFQLQDMWVQHEDRVRATDY